MRHIEQLALTAPWIGHEHASELAKISERLDAQPRLAALIQQDLLAACPHNPRTGHAGLTGDQVLRILLARQLNGWTYAELAFHLADSASYRTFCRVSGFGPAPSKSALAANLRRVQPQTLATLNALLVTSDAARMVETGRIVRIDSTVVPVAIHHPTDSSILLDGVRVLLRLLRRAEHLVGFTAYHRHMKRVKRRALEIQHLAPQATGPRRTAYRQLLGLTQATADYASYALAHVEGLPPTRALRGSTTRSRRCSRASSTRTVLRALRTQSWSPCFHWRVCRIANHRTVGRRHDHGPPQRREPGAVHESFTAACHAWACSTAEPPRARAGVSQ